MKAQPDTTPKNATAEMCPNESGFQRDTSEKLQTLARQQVIRQMFEYTKHQLLQDS
jgi:hypothetical protein